MRYAKLCKLNLYLKLPKEIYKFTFLHLFKCYTLLINFKVYFKYLIMGFDQDNHGNTFPNRNFDSLASIGP